MMKYQASLLLSLWVGVAGMHVSLAGDETDPPCPRLVLKELEVCGEDEYGKPAPVPSMSLRFALENRGGWHIAWGGEDLTQVRVEDSAGGRATDLKSFFWEKFGSENGDFRLMPQGWLPSSGAQWVRATGEVTFALFRSDDTSMPVTIKWGKGDTVPVVLKGAGMVRKAGGVEEDVTVNLVVGEYLKNQPVVLTLTADRRLGIRSVELQTKDGLPVASDHEPGPGTFKDGRYEWGCMVRLKEDPAEEYQAVVRYAKALQEVSVKVDSRVSLSGFAAAGAEPPCRHGAGAAKAGMAANKRAPAGKELPEGKAPVVTVAWKDFSMGVAESWSGTAAKGSIRLNEGPVQLRMTARLSTSLPATFGNRLDKMEQSLEVTDSTGRVLKPAENLNLWAQKRSGKDGRSFALLSGWWPELASPGAEWVRFKGILRLPVGGPVDSPVYELPLVKGAELQPPVPGMDIVADVGDVAATDDGPVCKLRLKDVTRQANQDVDVEMELSVEGVPFDLIEFVFVDDQGRPLQVDHRGGGNMGNLGDMTWEWEGTIKNAGVMKNLRVKLRYKDGTKLTPVPVDFKIGLGGPVRHNKQTARK